MVKNITREQSTINNLSSLESKKPKSTKTLGRTWQSLEKLSGKKLKEQISKQGDALFKKLAQELNTANKTPPKALIYKVIDVTIQKGVLLQSSTRNNFFKALFQNPKYTIKPTKSGSFQKMVLKLLSNIGLNFGKHLVINTLKNAISSHRFDIALPLLENMEKIPKQLKGLDIQSLLTHAVRKKDDKTLTFLLSKNIDCVHFIKLHKDNPKVLAKLLKSAILAERYDIFRQIKKTVGSEINELFNSKKFDFNFFLESPSKLNSLLKAFNFPQFLKISESNPHADQFIEQLFNSADSPHENSKKLELAKVVSGHFSNVALYNHIKSLMDGSDPLTGLLKGGKPHLINVLITLLDEKFWMNHWDSHIDQPMISNSFINNLITKSEELGIPNENINQFLKSIVENFSASALNQLFKEDIPNSHPPKRLIEVLEKHQMPKLVNDIEAKISLGNKA